MVPPLPHQSAAHRKSVRIANRIGKGYQWGTFRHDTRPRGLSWSLNCCYRNSSLQTLLHLPRFVNWIMKHNQKDQKWDCNAKKLSTSSGAGSACSICLMKTLIQGYWGKNRLGQDGEPLPLSYNNPAIIGLHRLAQEQYALEQNQDGQQCADDYIKKLLNSIEGSINVSNPQQQQLRCDEFDSLFKIILKTYSTCDKCQERFERRDEKHPGLVVYPEDNTTDGLMPAIEREMNDTEQEKAIDASPEYLSIHRSIGLWNKVAKVASKNRNRFEIPEILDLTRHSDFKDEPSPLLYKLVHVIYHRGHNMQSGHYCAGVTSAPGRPPGNMRTKNIVPSGRKFWCNDRDIIQMEQPQQGPNIWTVNPVRIGKDKARFEPYILWYERTTMPKETDRPKETSGAKEIPDTETIGQRVRKRKEAERM